MITSIMGFIVRWQKKVNKQLAKCPKEVQELFKLLIDDIKRPEQSKEVGETFRI